MPGSLGASRLGYLWSPKRKANGHSNAYYDFMRERVDDVEVGEVAPGDVSSARNRRACIVRYTNAGGNGRGLSGRMVLCGLTASRRRAANLV